MKLIFKRFIPYTVGRHFTVLFACSFRLDISPGYKFKQIKYLYKSKFFYGKNAANLVIVL